MKRLQLLGTGPWDDHASIPIASAGRLVCGAGCERISRLHWALQKRFGEDPLRAATLSYDAVSLVAALVKTQGPQRFTETMLTNASGFSGIDGIFRFRPDGTNQRGLAVLRVTGPGAQVVSPAPKAFTGPGT